MNTLYLISCFFLQGWGFCSKLCYAHSDNIWQNELQQLKLTILSDALCKKFGRIDNWYRKYGSVVLMSNIRKELCGAFVNNANVTFVNYTVEAKSGEDENE